LESYKKGPTLAESARISRYRLFFLFAAFVAYHGFDVVLRVFPAFRLELSEIGVEFSPIWVQELYFAKPVISLPGAVFAFAPLAPLLFYFAQTRPGTAV
jgi:hypothetical protein